MKNLLLSVLVSGLFLVPLCEAKPLRQSTKPACATGRLIATFNEEGDVVTRDVRYYRCLLKQNASGYQIQDFYWPSARRQSDPVVVTDKKRLKAWNNADLKFTGPFVSWHETGQKHKEGLYADGLETGKWTEWYTNGQKELEGQFAAGKETGNWILWYENGQKQAEGPFVGGEENGPWTFWHENGQKQAEGPFVDGEENGRWSLWYKNGQKEAEGQLSAGKQTGNWIHWHENGRKAAEGRFAAGEQVGQWTAWYDNGKKQAIVHFDDNGQATGAWRLWHENGRKQTETVFKNGKVTSQKSWDESGNEIKPSDITFTSKAGSAAIARQNTNDIPTECAAYADKVIACSEKLSGGNEQLAESLPKQIEDLKRSWSLVSEQDQEQLRKMCIQAGEAFEPAAEQLGC